MEAIILAGGLGTRLRSVVKDQPKTLARVGKFPFLYYLINYLHKEGTNKFIFSLGYLHEQVEEFLSEHFPDLDYVTVIESEPLGTGGAIKLCLSKTEDHQVLLVNADTFFELNIENLYTFFNLKEADCVIALTRLEKFDRYGVVKLHPDNRVSEFIEKKFTEEGLINTGLILLNTEVFNEILTSYKGPFSFEKEVLEPNINRLKIYGMPQDGFFIDIGIPEDYSKAQQHVAFFETMIR